MSKYIDLLREHQEEPEKGKSANLSPQDAASDNPYLKSSDTDNQIIESLESLLDEQDDLIAKSPLTNDYEDEYVELLTDESTESEVDNSHHHEIIDSQVSQFGFDPEVWLKHIEQTLTSMFNAVKNNEPINIEILNEQLDTLFDQISENGNILDSLALQASKQLKPKQQAYHNTDLVNFSIMKMLFSLNIGAHLNISLAEQRFNAVAVMLSHLGLTSITESTRAEENSLSEAEVRQIQKFAHHYLSAHSIQHKHLHLVIREYNEFYNGSGPLALKKHDISWVARLDSLLSAFVSRMQSNNREMFAKKAIRDMVINHSELYDPQLLKALIESVTLYPVGCFVELNTGEVGQVIHVHNNSPLRPIVSITMNSDGGSISERIIDLKKQPSLMIAKSVQIELMSAQENT